MRKKILALAMACTMVLPNGNGLFYGNSYTSAATVQKTATDYSGYTAISTVEELQNISENGKYYLERDIDLSGVDWEPIKVFSGVFDGRGHSISNMQSIGEYGGGLFAEITGSATITNLTLEDIYIRNWECKPIGGIAGKIYTTPNEKVEISNCSVQGRIESDIAGGIVGECSPSDETVKEEQTSKIQTVMIKDCYSSGTFSNWHSCTTYLGGIAGKAENISIENCCNLAELAVDFSGDELYAGGIASEIQNSTISSCVNMGELKTEEEHLSGGICYNAMNSTIQDVQNIGTFGDEGSAGLVYNLTGNSTLSKGISITRKSSVEYYGITSYCDDTATISQCYHLKNDKNVSSENGVGLTGEELKRQSNFAGFDLNNIWSMSTDTFYGYPVLQNFKSKYPENITSFAFEQDETTVRIGKTINLTAQVKSEDVFDGTITYSSENPEIASVTNDGVVKGLKEGTTKIIAETDYGITATCTVTVKSAFDVFAFEKDKITLTVGSKETLSLKIEPLDELEGLVSYSSENANIAKVTTKTGVVTGLKEGTTTIIAKANNGATASCTVTVSGYDLEQIRLGYSSYEMLKGETFNLGETLVRLPEGSLFENPVWESSDPKVATVDSEGKITALSTGTTTITYKEGELTKSCEITVKEIVVTTDAKLTLGLGSKTNVNYKVTYNDGSNITNDEKSKLTFTSSNSKVVEVSGTMLTAKSVGTANITVSLGDKKAVCKVTVPAVKIKLPSKKTVQFGCTYAPFWDATVNADKNTIFSSVKWKSSNKKIASVNKYGVVTAKKSGKCTITATYKGKSSKCKITIPKVTVKLSKSKVTVRYNNFDYVYVSNKPSGANVYIKKVKSSKPKVANVSYGNGYVYVKGLKQGKTTVTVTFNNGAKKKFKVVVPKLNLEEKLLSQKCYATVGTIWKDSYGWRYSNVTINNNSNKTITYVKFSVLEYDNKGTRLFSNKSASSYKHYINDTIYSSCSTRVDYGYDMRKVRVCVEKVYFSDGKTWKNPCYKQWYKKYKKKYE